MLVTYRKKLIDKKDFDTDSIIDILLKERNITDKKLFLHPPRPENLTLSDFGYAKEWKKTAKLLKKIYQDKSMVVVYSDYDADGVTGAATLWESLHLLGFNAMPYVPDRKKEGYGFSIKGIDAVKKQYNPALIISVDHGITAREKITYAKSIGIPVVVTDHHLKPEKLPDDAVSIFHIPVLSGSGVAYYFAKEVFNEFKSALPETKRDHLTQHFKNEYPILAAIGTVADLVALVGPSRNLVYHGLESAIHTKRRGLLEIMSQAGITGKKITPYEVGFIIAPRINAVGRLRNAIDALRLLCTTNSKRAAELAGEMGSMNKSRQDMVKKSVEEALLHIKASAGQAKKIPKIITLVSDTWHEGVIGLIASKIAQEYYRPTIVMTKSDGFLKGSARSVGTFHLTNFLRKLKEHLVDVGGHQGAAGFTIEKAKLKPFLKAVEKASKTEVTDAHLEKKIVADLKIPLSSVTRSLALAIETLQPFGVGNTQPTFLSEVELVDAKLMGKTNNHLKMFVKEPNSESPPLELIAFSQGERFKELSTGMKLTVVYSLEINRWGGNEKLQGRLIYSNFTDRDFP